MVSFILVNFKMLFLLSIVVLKLDLLVCNIIFCVLVLRRMIFGCYKKCKGIRMVLFFLKEKFLLVINLFFYFKCIMIREFKVFVVLLYDNREKRFMLIFIIIGCFWFFIGFM